MDAGLGKFVEPSEEVKEQIADAEEKGEKVQIKNLFCKGDELELNGSLFRVMAIGRKTMTLKLLPWKIEHSAEEDDPDKESDC